MDIADSTHVFHPYLVSCRPMYLCDYFARRTKNFVTEILRNSGLGLMQRTLQLTLRQIVAAIILLIITATELNRSLENS